MNACGVISASLPKIIGLLAWVKVPREQAHLSRVLKLLLAPDGFFSPKRQLVPQPPVTVLVKFFMGSTKYTQIRSLGGDRVVMSLCWVWVPASGYGRKRRG